MTDTTTEDDPMVTAELVTNVGYNGRLGRAGQMVRMRRSLAVELQQKGAVKKPPKKAATATSEDSGESSDDGKGDGEE